MTISPDGQRDLLTSLGELLAAAGASIHIVVIGGASLQALGFVDRLTQDVDVVALVSSGGLEEADPFPPQLEEAIRTVARDYGVTEKWMNAGPADLMRLGLPVGFMERVSAKSYGPGLTVSFASRFDLIHFKLYATVDQGDGKHFNDLQLLQPTSDELLDAALWASTHDPSEGFDAELRRVLAWFGVTNDELDA